MELTFHPTQNKQQLGISLKLWLSWKTIGPQNCYHWRPKAFIYFLIRNCWYPHNKHHFSEMGHNVGRSLIKTFRVSGGKSNWTENIHLFEYLNIWLRKGRGHNYENMSPDGF